MLLVEMQVDSVLEVALAMSTLEAVVPVEARKVVVSTSFALLCKSSCMVESSSEMITKVDSNDATLKSLVSFKKTTWLFRDSFSVWLHVTVTLVTSFARTEIPVEAGFCSVRMIRVLMVLMTTSQEVADALVLPLKVGLRRLAAVSLAAVSPAEFAVRAFAVSSIFSEDCEQAEMALRPSSSEVLHCVKLLRQ